MLAEIDIKSAFCLLPVHPADWHLLGMKWKGNIHIDHCIPFGLKYLLISWHGLWRMLVFLILFQKHL